MRKSPIKHHVKAYQRKNGQGKYLGTIVRGYTRGKGQNHSECLANPIPTSFSQKIRAKYFGTVADLNSRRDLELATNSQDVNAIKEYFNNKTINSFDSFFVKVEDGEYVELYGFNGNTAYISKPIYKITI